MKEPRALFRSKRPGLGHGIEQVNVALFACALEQGERTVGHLDNVVNEVHVRVTGRWVGTEGFLFEVGEAIIVGIKDIVARVATVHGQIIPIGNAVLTVEAGFKRVHHGLVKQQAVPVTIQRVEQRHLATGSLHLHREQGFPPVVETVVVGVGTLGVRAKFLLSLVGQPVVVGISGRALVGVGP